jgi:hypothetical protein
MQIVLARILWIQGHWHGAEDLIQRTIESAQNDGAYSVCPTLVFGAIPIAIWNGDDAQARSLTDRLAEEAKRYTLGFWLRWADFFHLALQVRTGDHTCLPVAADPLTLETLATFSPALFTLDAATREKSGVSGWCSPEIRRVEGEWLLEQRAPDAVAGAEALFQEALGLARRQGALSWELRAATSLGKLWLEQDRAGAARDLVVEVLQRCPKLRTTQDLTAAQALIQSAESGAIRRPDSPGRSRLRAV